MTASLWASAWLSIRVASLAVAVAMVIAVPLAWWVSRTRLRGLSLIEALLTLPLVLPPTVVGYLLLLAAGAQGWLTHWSGYSIAFRFEGAVLAAAVVALPLIYLPARSAFSSIEPEMLDTARVLGANRLQMLWHVALPLSRRHLAGGLLLGFARALGEFGATLMVFGNQPARSTLPVRIYFDYEQGMIHNAWPAVAILLAVSAAVLVLYNFVGLGRSDR
jgi:molybdate transport system permease protein